jgi:hypothetical protein
MNIKIDDNLIEIIAEYYISFSKDFKKKMNFYNFLLYYVEMKNRYEKY